MKEAYDYPLSYINEFDDEELYNLRDEIISDIEFLKEIRDEKSLEFEFKRLECISDIIKKRNINEKQLKLSI